MSPLTPDFSFGILLLRVLPLFYHECVEEEKQFALCPSEVLAEISFLKQRLLLLLFSCPVVSDSFRPHGWQHARPPGPSPPPKFAQVHVHCISDALQSSHPLIPSYLSALNLSQHQGLFQWVSCSHLMTKILKLRLQHQPSQWIFRVDFPYNLLVWFPCCPRDF